MINSKPHALRRVICLLMLLAGGAAIAQPAADQQDCHGAPPAAKCEGNAWETAYQQGDLQVQRRDYQRSSLKEVKGVVRVHASLNALVALLKDAGFNRQWVYRSGGAKMLQARGDTQAWVYGVVDAPFPMDDRDTVVRFDYQQDPATRDVTITITNQPDFIPAKPGLVRVPDMGGFWRLHPQAGGWVQVTYQIYGDPGGWIPVWLANRAALLSVRHTLENLVSVVDRYAQASSDYVLEPGPKPAE